MGGESGDKKGKESIGFKSSSYKSAKPLSALLDPKECSYCDSTDIKELGVDDSRQKKYWCNSCNSRFSLMNRRDFAIKKWINKNRPDLKNIFLRLLEKDETAVLFAIGFEAGREFQKRTDAELNNPGVYSV